LPARHFGTAALDEVSHPLFTPLIGPIPASGKSKD